MNKIFQNKKLFIILGVVLVFIFIFYNLKNKQEIETIYTTPEKDKNKELIEKINQTDSDNDGLKDWEEILWGTDINNPDSDGDGMNDNDEILADRDPLTVGEGNLNKIINEKKEVQTSQTTLTQTDILAREIFLGYVSLKQNNLLGTEEQENFIERITSDNLNYKSEIKYITLNDLIIDSTPSQISLQKYSDNLKTIFSNIPELRDDNVILKETLDKNSPEILTEIRSNIVFYEKIIDNLIKIEIPLILQEHHLNLVNSFKKMIGNTEQMLLVFKDPVLALIGAKEYYNSTQEISEASAEIGEYFKQNNIQF